MSNFDPHEDAVEADMDVPANDSETEDRLVYTHWHDTGIVYFLQL